MGTNWLVPKKKKLKVAFLTHPQNIMPDEYYGSIRRKIYEVAIRLNTICEVSIFSKFHRSLDKEGVQENISHYRISAFLDERVTLRVLGKLHRVFGRPRYYFSKFYYYLGYLVRLSIKIRQKQIDVINVYNYSHFIPFLRFFNPGSKIVLHMCCEWLTDLDYRVADERLNKVDMVTGTSNHITQSIANKFPKHASKCYRLYNGINTKHFSRRNEIEVSYLRKKYSLKNNKVVMYIGRVTPEKGIHVLINAMKKVGKSYPRISLMIGGPRWLSPPSLNPMPEHLPNDLEKMKTDYESYLKNLSKDASFKIIFTGRLSYEELPLYYSLADVFAFPSFEEAFGNPLIEAMACGTPVIGNRVGGMLDIVKDGVTGLLVHPGDENDLASAVLRYLEDEEFSQKMAERGEIMVKENFTWDRMAQDLMGYFNYLMLNNGERLDNRTRKTLLGGDRDLIHTPCQESSNRAVLSHYI